MSMLDTEILRCEDSFTVEKVLHLFGASVHGVGLMAPVRDFVRLAAGHEGHWLHSF